jgi:hypothetical protein
MEWALTFRDHITEGVMEKNILLMGCNTGGQSGLHI